MHITPYSDASKFSRGGPWEPIAANFPSVAHWWKCSETSGSVLADAIGGVTLSNATSMTFAANSVSPARPNSGSTKTGTFAAVGTKPFFLFSVIALTGASGSLVLGDATNGYSIATSGAVAYDGVTTVTGGAYTLVSGTVGRGVLLRTYNAVGGAEQYESNASTSNALAAVATTGLVDMDLNQGGGLIWAATPAGAFFYGAMLLVFNGTVPPAKFFKDMTAWLTREWAAGNKVLYPGLKGIS